MAALRKREQTLPQLDDSARLQMREICNKLKQIARLASTEIIETAANFQAARKRLEDKENGFLALSTSDGGNTDIWYQKWAERDAVVEARREI